MNGAPFLAAWGRLARDPAELRTSGEARMAAATLAVPVPAAGRAEGEPPVLWLRVIAFNRLAELLLRHRKGDPVAVSGRLELARWTGADGETRECWQVVADGLVSARTARPGGAAPAKAATATRMWPKRAAVAAAVPADLDDAPDF